MSTRNNETNIYVKDVMLTLDKFPVVRPNLYFKDALEEMGRSHLGIICITNDSGDLVGIFTDGDVRRKLLEVQKPFSAFFSDDIIQHAIKFPLTTKENATLPEAVDFMAEKKVWDLPVINDEHKLVGLLHLHPAIKVLLSN